VDHQEKGAERCARNGGGSALPRHFTGRQDVNMTELDDTELKSEIEAICARIDAIMQSIESYFQELPPTGEVQD
jgi:hypothetical protein